MIQSTWRNNSESSMVLINSWLKGFSKCSKNRSAEFWGELIKKKKMNPMMHVKTLTKKENESKLAQKSN
jgi:hypothetical protein